MRYAVFPLSFALALSLASPGAAQDAAPAREDSAGAIMRESDAAFTCEQLVEEGAAISKTLGVGDDAPMFGRFGGVLRLGASLLIPGAGMVMAGADALSQPEQERKQAEDLARMSRWYYLSGLYIGRGCDQPQAQPAATAPPPAH
ncbi:MAG: hypothetical protein V4707_08190 [Pseudomonadota bacterium]